jgi:serine/threonine protein kinase
LSSLRDRKKGGFNQVLKELSSLPGVTELALFADKSANQGNLLFSGRYQGRECFIKYSSLSDDGVRNEYKMGRYFYKLLAKHVPEMYRFIKIEAQGAACIMEKCTGVTLTEYLSRVMLSASEIDDLSDQFIKILNSFRNHGAAHRDFGAYNIIRCDDGILKVIDFQNSIAHRGKDSLAKVCFSRSSYYHLYATGGYGCGTFNDYARLRLTISGVPELIRALDTKMGVDIRSFDYHCPLPFPVVFHFLWNFPACSIRSWFLCKKTNARSKAERKKLVMRHTLEEMIFRISKEGVLGGLQNKRRYVVNV